MQTAPEDPYLQASYLSKLRETKTIFLTDLDGTHATKVGSLKELEDRAAVRQFLDKRGYVAGAVTARTPALTMTRATYLASRKLGFVELEPHCGFDEDGKRIYVPPEELPHFAYSQDWDVTACLGYGVYPRNGHGYLIDREFDNLLNYDHEKNKKLEKHHEPVPWRQAALAFLVEAWPRVREHFSPLEFRQNYLDGLTDVMPLPYRIQLHFEGSTGLALMRQFREVLGRKKSESDPVALRMAVVDESKPSAEVERSKYTIYLVPWAARKERMINHIVSRSAAAGKVTVKKLLYAGDTPTDLRAGLYAGGESPLTFLLATGSPLAPYLLEKRESFGEESLGFLWNTGKYRKPCLIETKRPGVYTCKVPGRRWTNTIVIGDKVYAGTTPPGSVRAFLEEFAT